ncbi:hypothetical protein DUNSADRAFT_845 [Dunaliella salina]|uniref:Encoded protein n=1 Tax=Dunaliella salina TaxID=3046 RepID=A0ABQ7FYC2_DUNSA|nr:hypothetical protein DUNSADRAFT_845 [Dunaliella salina]|eukprot:KAF5827336.1 hypothetical protein DUNSADRAFT_845 [Dunaliella salina]
MHLPACPCICLHAHASGTVRYVCPTPAGAGSTEEGGGCAVCCCSAAPAACWGALPAAACGALLAGGVAAGPSASGALPAGAAAVAGALEDGVGAFPQDRSCWFGGVLFCLPLSFFPMMCLLYII